MKISLLGAELINDGTNTSADLYLINGELYKVFLDKNNENTYIAENKLQSWLSNFSYQKNRDVEQFNKNNAIDFF